ncbi:1-acyl-sn-glycerol-3-phosphate acyltransferase [Acinetobacter sp. S40]|uniref:lysophospholipid acyltransferase family protein n=1 Tax=unclassified Acinetobacter TaxID=196816 RepID=UPI00190A11A0|nr:MULTISPECIES: lysophospholipid acyltransferase family protein [unclassified Acinetobacter]MBJ9986685.1 1-acyl-sn-glycerol-3-phosphate acyltransferase [Acinetobacter sp. S40]MBK0063199.1 1-acyl-sn-glycerol-3-phosphate acyltransferase [Acinetobacter sp. S55]MBK0066889.1 1-acyl-sn-glycerol-3-phosphate acyltransferase [Acinetobacter sp. S54]
MNPFIPNSINCSKYKNMISKTIARFIAFLTRRGARSLTGARSLWVGCQPELKQRIYYANHNSHIDFILLWSSLPKAIRRQTRPIAASDYWLKDGFRRFLIQDTFSGVTIRRSRENNEDPLQPVKEVLAQGYSIIFFPEGTRNLNDDVELLDFKSGLYHLSQAFPQVEVVPVWISNLKRVMPKGAFIPLPLLSTVIFGCPLKNINTLDKENFLTHARQELLKLKEAEYQ